MEFCLPLLFTCLDMKDRHLFTVRKSILCVSIKCLRSVSPAHVARDTVSDTGYHKPFTIPFGVMQFAQSTFQLLPSNTEQMTMIGGRLVVVCSVGDCHHRLHSVLCNSDPEQIKHRSSDTCTTAPHWIVAWFNSFLMLALGTDD